MKAKIKSFFKGVLIVFLAIVVIFMVFLFLDEKKSGDYNKITEFPIVKFPKLQYLRINNNKMINIEGLNKSYLPELKEVDLSYN